MAPRHEPVTENAVMKTPTIEQLERALHIRGAIETLQTELATLLNGLADVVAPKNHAESRSESKPPFADSLDGAREKRIRRKQKEGKPSSTLPAKRRRKSRKRGRLWSVLTGGEVGTAPVAAEPKVHGKTTRKKPRSKRTRKAAKRGPKPRA